MLGLDDERWASLSQAYGDGRAVAAWLKDLTSARDVTDARGTFWKPFDTYGHLCHQETVYSATYATIPHLVEYAKRVPVPDQFEFRVDLLDFIGFSAACPLDGISSPGDLASDYQDALHRTRRLIAETMTQTEDEGLL